DPPAPTKDETDDQEEEAGIGKPPMGRWRASIPNRRPDKARNDMIANTENHHRHEAEEEHMRVCRAIHRPLRARGHRQTGQTTEKKPGNRGLEKALNEPIHFAYSN